MRQRMRELLGGRRRRLLLGSTGAVAVAGVFAISALAVHDEAFQLDGDVIASTTTSVGGSQQPFDWDSLFTAGGAKQNPVPSGFGAAAFTRDFKTTTKNGQVVFDTSDDSTYATGSKDTLPIAGWQCNRDNNVNNKIDVSNAYSAAYENTAGDDILYFGLERAYNGGDANVGFWFLQDAVSCESTGGAKTFIGEHSDGDLLIVSAFTKGGAVSGVDVYRWNGGANGSLGTTPVVQGGADCKSTAGGDTACATVNATSNGTGGTITTPWPTNSAKFGVSHQLPVASFFEGALNLTKADLDGKCFNSFLGVTRSSQSLTATLFDYAGGTIGECTSTTTTTPVDDGGTPIPQGGLTIPTDPASSAVLVKDRALIEVKGVDTFDGSVSFWLCGPTAADATATCDSDGVPIGSSKPITSNGTVTSDAATVTSAGRYCWRAVFTGDDGLGVPGSSDSAATECFVVNPVKPTVTTDAGTDVVDFGSSITDTATLSGTAHKPGSGGPAGSDGTIDPTTPGGDATGTITFKLYDNDSCSGTPVHTTTKSVTGDGDYTTDAYTPTAPGTYHWVAQYGGDAPNTLASDAGACDDPAEAVTVRQIQTSIKTKQSWLPNDTATVAAEAGNLAAGGKVTFELFANATCDNAALYSEEKSISGGAPTETVSTSNTTFAITTAFADPANSTTGVYSWRVTYAPAAGDTAHVGRQSTCDAERFDIDYTNDPGPGVKFP